MDVIAYILYEAASNERETKRFLDLLSNVVPFDIVIHSSLDLHYFQSIYDIG